MPHLPWGAVPARVRTWAEQRLGGPVTWHEEQTGGMSPGNATRLRTREGLTGFVKAVGPELHPATPELFRRELAVLRAIGPDPRWAALLAGLDEGPDGWVALLLEDVEGRHPDLADDDECATVARAVDDLSATLVAHGPALPMPADVALLDSRTRLEAWSAAFDHHDAVRAVEVPDVVRAAAPLLRDRLTALAAHPSSRLVHWDIRADNLILRPSGEVVVVDWGQAGLGPGWLDPLLARLDRAGDAWFDDAVLSPSLGDLDADDVTSFVAGLGLFLGWRATTHADSGPAGLQEFRITEARRLLAGARRRLS